MAEIALLPAADGDYQDAYAWYHERSEEVVSRFELAIEKGLRRIADAPLRWTRFDDRHRIHVIDGFPFAIVYRVVGEQDLVVAVAHTHRRPEFWSDRG